MSTIEIPVTDTEIVEVATVVGAPGKPGEKGDKGDTGSKGDTITGPPGADATGKYIAVRTLASLAFAPVLSDQGNLIALSNFNAITVTMPTNALVPFPVGAQIDFVQLGTGKITFTGAIVATPTLTTRTQFSVVTLIKLALNQWLAVGDLA